ncbi:MAG: hypothetical protein ACI9XB_004087 [Gammaproteobacteria bacterium]|jgi:hypothetical protein
MKLNFTLFLTFLSLVFSNQAQAQSACNGLTYCPAIGDSGLEWIESFEMGSINNVSGNSTGYGDFTNLSTDITIGQFVNLTCTPGYPGGSFNEVFQVWIDFNSDGDFDDTGEQIFESGQTQVAVSGSFLVPAGAVVGSTAMRVRMDYIAINTPCENGGFEDGEVEDYCVNILAGSGCNQSLLSISDITDTDALASWPAVTGAESYNVRFREVGAPMWTTVNTTTPSITLDLQGCMVYEAQLETVCSGGVSSDFGPISEFLTFGCGNCLDFAYCPIENANTNNAHIENVTLNTLNNTSGDDQGYGNFTGPTVTSLEQGLSYNITTTVVNDGYAYDQWYTAYIDFNADGDFDDPFELVMNSGQSLTDLAYTHNFPVPPTAVVGASRLRVIVQNFNFNDLPTEPCVNFLNGEVEDYCIEITEGSGCYLPLETAVIDNLGDSLVIEWENGLIAESFSIQYREIGSPTWIEINDITGNSYVLADLDECTNYEFQIKTNCVDMSTSWSSTISIKTFGCGACFDFSYCESFATNSNDDFIGGVNFGTMDNVSGNNGGYIDFADDFSLTVRPDSTYSLILTPEWPGFTYNVAWSVHIDYNADGDFDDANELIFSADASQDVQTADITIPIDAAFGLTKMRVSMREGIISAPCDNWTFGEVEDYCISILPTVLPCLLPQNLDTTNVTDQSVEMIWEMDQYELAIGYIIRFKEVVETDWMEFSVNFPTYTAYNLTLCTDYEFQVRTVCPQDFSEYTESFIYKTSCTSSTEDLSNLENINALNVYPNPFSERIVIDFELKKSSDIIINLTNLNGQLLQVQKLNNLGEGQHHTEFQPAGLAPGMYLIQVATEDEVVIRKVVKE